MKISKFILILAAVSCAWVAYSQNDYQKQLDAIFEIPANKIPTGILIDRSPVLIDMSGYNPLNKLVDTCNVSKWINLYYRIYASHLDLEKFPYDKLVAKKYPYKVKEKGEIPLGIIFYDYNKFKSNAVTEKTLSVDTVKNKIIDISGNRGTPIEQVTCFAMSTLTDTIQAGTYSFYLAPSLFISNKTKDFDELYIDFDDKQGFVKVFPESGRKYTEHTNIKQNREYNSNCDNKRKRSDCLFTVNYEQYGESN
jgi:hypothetical protein